MNAIEVKKGVYWVGAIDWDIRNFHGYTTNRGATYNAFLIIDEKITLIDTVKNTFADELIARISSIIDPAKIDYIVSNHVEMDHSGALPEVMKVAPNATIVTSSPQGMKGLMAHYGEFNYMPVKPNETLNIGSRTLRFVPTPMVHWPDNMVTYCPEEKILFSNDSFGQHYASNGRFDDEEPFDIIMEEAQKYYANIVLPYSKQAATAVNIVKDLDVEIIATSHGVIWRSHVKDIFEAYEKWTSLQSGENALIVYDSMWHSTEKIAKAIEKGFASKGVTTEVYDLKETHISDIMTRIIDAKYLAVGSPTLNNGYLPTVAGFLCYLKGLSAKNHLKAFAFGSYGWGGQSIGMVEQDLIACGYDICLDKIRIQYIPSKEQLDKITEDVANLVDSE